MEQEMSGQERRNYRYNVIEGASYLTTNAFFSIQVALPALVVALGGSNLAAGAVSVIYYAGTFLPQILSARYAEASPWKKTGTVGFGAAQRMVVLVMAAALWWYGGSRPELALVWFFILYMINQTLCGITTPFWYDLVVKVTPFNRRGRLVGLRNSLGGGGALIGGFIFTWLLATFAFPLNFVFAFLLTAVLQIVSVLVQTKIEEPVPSNVQPRVPAREYFRSLMGVIRGEPAFARFVVAMGLIIIGSMPVGFYTVYALRELHAPDAMIGEFTIAMMMIQIVSAYANGLIADRYGNRTALIIAGGSLVVSSALALVSSSSGMFRIVFMFVGINVGSEVMARYNMAVEFSPERKRSTYLGLMNTLLAPCYLAGLLGGVVSDMLGYKAVFMLGLTFALAGVLLLAYGVEDPRRRHLAAVHAGRPA